MQVSDQIIAVLDNLCQKMGIVLDWGSENVLPYAQDLVARYTKYLLAESWVWVWFWAIFGGVSCAIFYRLYKNRKGHLDSWGNVSEGWGILMVFACIASAAGTVGFIATLGKAVFTTIKVVTVPEMLILEKLQLLMASVTGG